MGRFSITDFWNIIVEIFYLSLYSASSFVLAKTITSPFDWSYSLLEGNLQTISATKVQRKFSDCTTILYWVSIGNVYCGTLKSNWMFENVCLSLSPRPALASKLLTIFLQNFHQTCVLANITCMRNSIE